MKARLLVLTCLLCLLAGKVGAAEKRTITFGIVPQQAASKLAKLWVPILSYINERTGYHLQFKTAPNIPEFEKRCAEGKYDIAYMNPYHYTVFNRIPGYIAFAKQKNKRIRGIVVVRNDSDISSLSELSGKEIAFPAPAAFAASVLPRARLTADKIPFTPTYVASHDSVYRSVARGLFSAGGGIERTFNNVAPDVRKQLKILWTTESYTPHAFAALPRINAEVVDAISNALVEMDRDPKGKELLKGINFEGLEIAKDEDWNDIRSLGIELLESLIKG